MICAIPQDPWQDQQMIQMAYNCLISIPASELISAVNEVKSNFSSTSLYVLTSCNDQLPEGFTCLEDQINRMSSDKIDVSLRTGICGKTHAVFIFTSGTTGNFLFCAYFLSSKFLYHFYPFVFSIQVTGL